jgi:hypothetical protein
MDALRGTGSVWPAALLVGGFFALKSRGLRAPAAPA